MKKRMIGTRAAFWIAGAELFFGMIFGDTFLTGFIGAFVLGILLNLFGQDVEFSEEESDNKDTDEEQDNESESASTREAVTHKH